MLAAAFIQANLRRELAVLATPFIRPQSKRQLTMKHYAGTTPRTAVRGAGL